MTTRALALTVALVASSLAHADIVHLKHGGTLEGQVTQTKDHVVVRLPEGEVRLPKAAVARVEERPTALDEYQKRAAALKPDDAEARYRLGLWAQSRSLRTQSREQFRKAIAIDPDHAQARAALGYRRYKGTWMTEEQEMQARGLVQHKGEWMSPEAAQRLKQLEAELEVAREKRKAAETQLQETRERIEAADQAPPTAFDVNPYDRYYATRELDRRARLYDDYGWPGHFHYSRSYYRLPHAYHYSYSYRPYSFYAIPYGFWWFYPGGRRYVPPSRRR